MDITPLKNNVLVKPFKQLEELSKGGIVLPNIKKISPTEAIVAAVGPGANPLIKVGQRIKFQKFQGHECGDCVIMPDAAVLAIMEGGEENG